MDKIPDEIQKKIEEKFPGGYWNEKHRPAEFGYSLASEQLLEKDKEIERLRKGIVDDVLPHMEALLPTHVQAMHKRIKELEEIIKRAAIACGKIGWRESEKVILAELLSLPTPPTTTASKGGEEK